jgi:hypothetical protein
MSESIETTVNYEQGHALPWKRRLAASRQRGKASRLILEQR